MNHSLNSLKGGYIRDYIGDYYRDIKGDTRSLDHGPCADSLHVRWGGESAPMAAEPVSKVQPKCGQQKLFAALEVSLSCYYY